MREVLVELEHAHGTAAVVRDHEGVWVTCRLEDGGGTMIGDRIAREGIDGRYVYGGLLPPGATRAVVGGIDAARCGGGAWLVLTAVDYDDRIPVRFEDAAGRIVPWPRRRGRRTPVEDAVTACPACDARAWETVRGVAVCATCGYEEGTGMWYAYAGDDDMDEAQMAAWDAERRREQEATLALIDFPLHVADGLSDPALSGWAGSGDRIESAALRHEIATGRWLQVETARGRGRDPRHERHALEAALHEPVEWPELSPAATALWLHATQREVAAAVAAAAPLALRIAVDGRLTEFTGLHAGDAWAASADVLDLRVTLSARGVDPAAFALRRFSR